MFQTFSHYCKLLNHNLSDSGTLHCPGMDLPETRTFYSIPGLSRAIRDGWSVVTLHSALQFFVTEVETQ